MPENIKLKEKQLQSLVHSFISDPSKIFTTNSGRRLQILSPGRINDGAGPDFSEIAILLEGYVLVGDGEFHRNASEWDKHNHGLNRLYDNVILHIVLNNDEPQSPCEVLILNETELPDKGTENAIQERAEATIEELQNFALIRLLRKASEAQRTLNESGTKEALKILTRNYIDKYIGRQTRPVYESEKLIDLISQIQDSRAYNFLEQLAGNKEIQVPDLLQVLIKKPIVDEGAHLRREIVLNAILPLAVCIAGEKSRIKLFLWYWSVPALNRYGILNKKFPDLPQNYLWQQQGMLEYLKEYGKKSGFVSEAIKQYGFAEVLSFYRYGVSPIEQIFEENEDM